MLHYAQRIIYKQYLHQKIPLPKRVAQCGCPPFYATVGIKMLDGRLSFPVGGAYSFPFISLAM